MIDKNEITRRLKEWIDQMERSGKHVNQDDINRHLGEIIHAQNAMLLKTDDIHPPKTGISVHFSCSLS